jgi:hypothetical protein
MSELRRRLRLVLAGGLLLPLVACDDAALTEPAAYAHEADGRVWVAVAPPQAAPPGAARGGQGVTTLVRELDALERWRHSAAAAGVGEGLDPEFDRARRGVAVSVAAAGRALREADHESAAAHLASGRAAAEQVAPRAVAARVIERAERRMEELGAGGVEAERALRLLRGARLALEESDDPRALRRALYALQVAQAALSDG